MSISAPALGGAGGCAIVPSPTQSVAGWRARWKRMTSITRRGTRAKPHTAGRRPWDADRVAAARSVSPAGAIRIKTGQRLLRGSVARGLLSSRRPVISPSRRCKRPLTSPCKRAVGSIRTRPAVSGHRSISSNLSKVAGGVHGHEKASKRLASLQAMSPATERLFVPIPRESQIDYYTVRIGS